MVALAVRPDVHAAPPMTRDEAQSLDDKITEHLDAARRDLYEMKVRRGWHALGYQSFSAYALDRHGLKSSQASRITIAAEIEMLVTPDGAIGAYPERTLRPLAPFRTQPEVAQMLFEVAAATSPNMKLTGSHLEATIDELSNALTTGMIEDEPGYQNPVAARLTNAVMNRVAENMRAQTEHIKSRIERQTGKRQHVILEKEMTVLTVDLPDGKKKKVSNIVIQDGCGTTVFTTSDKLSEPVAPGQRVTVKIMALDT